MFHRRIPARVGVQLEIDGMAHRHTSQNTRVQTRDAIEEVDVFYENGYCVFILDYIDDTGWLWKPRGEEFPLLYR